MSTRTPRGPSTADGPTMPDVSRSRLVADGDWSLSSGHRGAAQLLAREPGLRGLFVASDLMAAGALEALRILDDQIAGRVRRPVHLLLSSELVERGSC